MEISPSVKEALDDAIDVIANRPLGEWEAAINYMVMELERCSSGCTGHRAYNVVLDGVYHHVGARLDGGSWGA